MAHPAIDPTFYRTAAEAAAAPGEQLAYVVAFDRRRAAEHRGNRRRGDGSDQGRDALNLRAAAGVLPCCRYNGLRQPPDRERRISTLIIDADI